MSVYDYDVFLIIMKSTLLNILAGIEKESSGTVLYEDNPYETNWLGKIQTHDDVFYTKEISINKFQLNFGNFVKC